MTEADAVLSYFYRDIELYRAQLATVISFKPLHVNCSCIVIG